MKRILLLTDFSKKAEHAAEYALHMACNVKADILLYNAFTTAETISLKEKFNRILDEFFSVEDESMRRIKELAHHLEQKVKENATAKYKPSIKYMCKAGNVGNLGSTLKKILDDKKIWMIVMGSKGDDCLSNFIFGTNAYSVISNTTCPVLFIPLQAQFKDLKRIAIATDLPCPELSPLLFLKDFKNAYNMEIILAHVSVNSTVSAYNAYNEEGLVEVFMYDITANLEYPKILFSDNKDKDINNEFALKSKIDILGLIHRNDDVFHRLFHSGTTKLLVDSPQLPLLVFPESMKKT